jgi:acyl-CoA synthetase (AMP-forming)/AMP-acid ligase II
VTRGAPSFRDKAVGAIRAVSTNFLWDPASTTTVSTALRAWASERPGDRFLWFEGREWTVAGFQAEVDRHARAYDELGLRRGEVVALVMENSPSYLFHLYGLLELGVVASLVNPGLRGPVLARALEACAPRAVVAGDGQVEAVGEVFATPACSELLHRVPRFHDPDPHPGPPPPRGGGDRARPEPSPPPDAGAVARSAGGGSVAAGFLDWRHLVEAQPRLAPARLPALTLMDVAAYIYTSGTTGMPKPAVVKHHRLFRAGTIFGGFSQLGAGDCMYCCLPLYHGNGAIIATPMTIVHRCRLALARRFSANRFWDDCEASGSTIFVYVGELCRYLHGAAPATRDREHGIDRVVGNGLRPSLYDPFKVRFGIRKVLEFYAATEGNAETVNFLSMPGSLGLLLLWKMALIRYDLDRGEPVRGPDGFCQRVGAGEPGLLVGKIAGKNDYPGYSSREASRRKVLTDVFRRGDAWFDTGDLLRRDRLLHLYFVDRLGDTFRWKGQNVSTEEVAEALAAVPGVAEASVYGVEVPGQEGRVGMAALTVDGRFDPRSFFEQTAERLPPYAQPRFLRLVESMLVTASLRHRKGDLKAQGFGPAITDPLLVRDPTARTYRPIDDELRKAIDSGEWPL